MGAAVMEGVTAAIIALFIVWLAWLVLVGVDGEAMEVVEADIYDQDADNG